MALARLLVFACAALLVGCSGEGDVRLTATNRPGQGVTFVAPAATPLPAPILNDGCPVTEANGSTPPGERPSTGHHGNGAIWTVLWPNGTVTFQPGGPGAQEEDGALSMKFAWWRAVEGRLEVTGRRLDGSAPPLRASIPEGYGNTGFQASGLIFPTPGCWEVTAKAGPGTLAFVTRVVSLY